MKPFSIWHLLAGLAAIWVVCAHMPAFADTYYIADFSGAMYGGSNVDHPFLGNGFNPNGPVTGSFVYDAQLIPKPSSEFSNVFFSSFPDMGKIPAATAFTINLGKTPLTFTLADAMEGSGAIQYNPKGQFNGFFFVTDFTFEGQQYQFADQGGQWNIQALVGGNPDGVNLVSGYINNYDSSLKDIGEYTPSGVPLPGTVWLLGSGLLGLGGLGLRRKKKA